MKRESGGVRRDTRYLVDPETSIEWLELVVTMVTIVALTVVYLMLPQSEKQPPWLELLKACIPNAITALVIVPTVFLVLKRAGLGADQKIYRAIEAAFSSRESAHDVFVNDVSGISAEVMRYASAVPTGEPITVRILAYTGATFTTALLREMIDRFQGRISIDLHIMDFDTQSRTLFPGHWPQEAKDTQERLKHLCAGRAKLTVSEYVYFPFVLGLEVNGHQLFLAFPQWAEGASKLADKPLSYSRHVKRDETNVFFELFDNWIGQPDQKPLVSVDLPSGKRAGSQ